MIFLYLIDINYRKPCRNPIAGILTRPTRRLRLIRNRPAKPSRPALRFDYQANSVFAILTSIGPYPPTKGNTIEFTTRKSYTSSFPDT